MPIERPRQFASKPQYGMPLGPADVDVVRADLAVLRDETMNLRADCARDLVQTTQVRIELDNAADRAA